MSKSTRTSEFGTSGRENHDSSYFYGSKMYENIGSASSLPSDCVENKLPKALLNSILCRDSRDLSIIPDTSLHLVVTSPPYNNRKEYDQDLTLNEYLKLIEDVFMQIYPKLVDGGRIVLNIANLGRKPYIPVTDYVSKILKEIGYIQRGEIIWSKGASAGVSCAWGSWKSSSNPVLRDIHEYLLIFSKGTMKRTKEQRKDTITKEEFIEYTKSIWTFNTESAKKIGHPAPFPQELPYRCIQLYSYQGDVIFDPFIGSGTTAMAAIKSGRKYLGIDNNQDYVNLANKRINSLRDDIK